MGQVSYARQRLNRVFSSSVIVMLWGISFAHAADTADIYLGAYFVGGFFDDRSAKVNSIDSLSTTMHDGAGGGARLTVFPKWTNRIIGFAIEYFGTSSRLSFTQPINGGTIQGSSGLLMLNSMASLVARWPDGPVEPYLGFGIGHSSGVLYNQTIPNRSTRDFDSTAAFAYQFMAGLQSQLTAKIFIFTEYKRLAADFHWNGMALDVRANYVAAGFGIKF